MAMESVVTSRVSAARAQAREAKKKVHRASAARLMELARLPPDERMEHLDDPDLTLADRVTLRRSLQAGLSRRRSYRFWPSGQRSRRWAVNLACPILRLEISVPLLLATVWLALAWHRTAWPATLTRDVHIRIMKEDGQIGRGVLQRGRAAIVQPVWGGGLLLRRWDPSWGYETVALPPDAIAWGWPNAPQSTR
jgi:hypothetical protein